MLVKKIKNIQDLVLKWIEVSLDTEDLLIEYSSMIDDKKIKGWDKGNHPCEYLSKLLYQSRSGYDIFKMAAMREAGNNVVLEGLISRTNALSVVITEEIKKYDSIELN